MDLFWLKLLLSFLVGGAYIAFTIWASEKFGSRIGGLLIGMPSTVLVSLIFIAWTQDLTVAVSAVPIMPAVMAANSLFISAFILLHGNGEARAFIAGLAVWFILTLPLAIIHLENIIYSLLIAAVYFAIAIIVLRKFPHKKLPAFATSKKEFIVRSVFAGMVVAISVFLGKEFGPLWGGMFASFPAAFSSSILLITRKHGIRFAASVARSMPFGSMANVVFVVAFFLSAPAIGIIQGILLSLIVSIAAAAAFYKLFLK